MFGENVKISLCQRG